MKNDLSENQTSATVLLKTLADNIKSNLEAIATLVKTSVSGSMDRPINDLKTANLALQGQLDDIRLGVILDSGIMKLKQAINNNGKSTLLADHLKLVTSESFSKDSISYIVTIDCDGIRVTHNKARKASTSNGTRKSSGKLGVTIFIDDKELSYSSAAKAVKDLVAQGHQIKGTSKYSGEILDSTYNSYGINDYLTLDKNNIKYERNSSKEPSTDTSTDTDTNTSDSETE